jgi:DNA-binding CsgD family transcriptional regulator
MDNFNLDSLKFSETKEICQPLIDFFDIGVFSYLNIYPDLSRIHLDSNHEWNNHFYKHIDKYSADDNLTESTHWEPGFATCYSLNDPCIPDGNLLGIGNGIVIANTLEDCTELCYIGSKYYKEEETVSNMLNNIGLLQKFITYFRDKAKTLITEAKKSPIVLPHLSRERPTRSFGLTDKSKLDFINRIRPKDQSITPREYECLQQLTQGLSSKQIARKLNIQPKTVDRHIESLKVKFNVRKRVELLTAL